VTTSSRLPVVGALVAIVAFVAAAVLFASGDAVLERLGILAAIVAPTVAGLVAALRSDAAATSTDATSSIAQALNGGFEARVRHATRQVAAEVPGSAHAVATAARDAATAAALADPDKPPVPGP